MWVRLRKRADNRGAVLTVAVIARSLALPVEAGHSTFGPQGSARV